MNSNSGIGLPTLLFLIFLVLKLTGVITWSWVWVTAPLWISFILFLVVMTAVLGYHLWDQKRRPAHHALNDYARSLGVRK